MRAAGNRTGALSWPRRILGHRSGNQCDRFAARTGLDSPARIRPANSLPKGRWSVPGPGAWQAAQDRSARLVGSNAATSDRRRGCSVEEHGRAEGTEGRVSTAADSDPRVGAPTRSIEAELA